MDTFLIWQVGSELRRLLADGSIGFLAMPKYWEADPAGGGVALTAGGREVRAHIGQLLAGATDKVCWRTAGEAMTFAMDAVERARAATRDWAMATAHVEAQLLTTPKGHPKGRSGKAAG